MLFAADFRAMARQALRGNWLLAVIAGVIASLVTTSGSAGPNFNVTFESGQLAASMELFGQTVLSTVRQSSFLPTLLAGGAAVLFLVILALAVLYGVLGSVVSVGYARFNLNLVNGFGADLHRLLDYFPYWKTTFCAHFLRGLYTLLWTLLFIIPGILASYNYAMVNYILSDHPNITASEALAASKDLMYGNRWRLFCLRWSFFGWNILAGLTLGIGNLWLRPYKEAAYAAFYRSLR